MKWSYSHSEVYGLSVTFRDNVRLMRYLESVKDIVTATPLYTLHGPDTLYVYVNSSYTNILHATGTSDSPPDIYGDDENMPVLPTFLIKLNKAAHDLTPLELEVLEKIRTLTHVCHAECEWRELAYLE